MNTSSFQQRVEFRIVNAESKTRGCRWNSHLCGQHHCTSMGDSETRTELLSEHHRWRHRRRSRTVKHPDHQHRVRQERTEYCRQAKSQIPVHMTRQLRPPLDGRRRDEGSDGQSKAPPRRRCRDLPLRTLKTNCIACSLLVAETASK